MMQTAEREMGAAGGKRLGVLLGGQAATAREEMQGLCAVVDCLKENHGKRGRWGIRANTQSNPNFFKSDVCGKTWFAASIRERG